MQSRKGEVWRNAPPKCTPGLPSRHQQLFPRHLRATASPTGTKVSLSGKIFLTKSKYLEQLLGFKYSPSDVISRWRRVASSKRRRHLWRSNEVGSSWSNKSQLTHRGSSGWKSLKFLRLRKFYQLGHFFRISSPSICETGISKTPIHSWSAYLPQQGVH